MKYRTKRKTIKKPISPCSPDGDNPETAVESRTEETGPSGAGEITGLECSDMLDALPFYVMLIDENHYILYANKAVRSELDIEPEDIIGKYCPKVIHGIDGPFHGCPLEEAAEKRQAVERELFDSKSERWLRSAIYPTKGLTSQGKRIFLHMVTDITDRKRAEEQLKASHEQLRSLSGHLESAQEEERKKIARDLHDDTSQLLASLGAHLEAAIGMLPPDAHKVKAMLRNAEKLCVNVIDQIQKLIYELRPLLLDDWGLVSAVGWLVDNNLKPAGIKVNFRTTGTARRLDRQIETSIFRVVQEAANNIIRHSQAKKANIAVHFKKNSVRVSITDDGKGFDINEATSLKDGLRGFGLLGMRERVELIDGTFNLESTPGSGTKIEFEVPLNNRNRAVPPSGLQLQEHSDR